MCLVNVHCFAGPGPKPDGWLKRWQIDHTPVVIEARSWKVVWLPGLRFRSFAVVRLRQNVLLFHNRTHRLVGP
jgi:hypothetical protein